MSQVNTLFANHFCRLEQRSEDKHVRLCTTDAVAVLVYNKRTGNVIFVKQDRFPMETEDNPSGTTTEVPAGRFDYQVKLVDLIVNEVWEETGVMVSPKKIAVLNEEKPLASSSGVLMERIYVAFAIVDFYENLGSDGTYGVEGEKIKRLGVPVTELEDSIFDDLKTWALVQWFLNNLRKLGLGSIEEGLRRLVWTTA